MLIKTTEDRKMFGRWRSKRYTDNIAPLAHIGAEELTTKKLEYNKNEANRSYSAENVRGCENIIHVYHVTIVKLSIVTKIISYWMDSKIKLLHLGWTKSSNTIKKIIETIKIYCGLWFS